MIKYMKRFCKKVVQLMFKKYCSAIGTDFHDITCTGCKHMDLCLKLASYK